MFMAFPYLTSAVLCLLFTWNMSAHPQLLDPLISTQVPTIFPRSLNINPPSNITLLIPSRELRCYEPKPGRSSTSIDGCRPTLNYFRTFPKYRVVQDFLEGWWPKEPSPPPYAVHHEASNCAIRIASFDSRVLDRFSFEQVRQLATDILTDCEGNGGVGGIANIGRGLGWTVAVIGIDEPVGGNWKDSDAIT